ncbi:MAG: HEAT repeat domain-containing protein [Deltaproteobacteria bacterium]|nr:HEAT repeat domain-containing protein [Deltaproteobacteria bacterium]
MSQRECVLGNHKEIVTLLRQKGAKESSFPPKETREIQRMLKFLGYEPDPFDGIAGDATVAAVKSFQQSNSLTPDGEFSVELKKSLEESLLKSTGPKSIEQLIAILGLDPYSYYGIQKYAIDALVSVGSPAVGQLVVLLKDKDPEVRKQSIRVLHEIKGERVIDPLIIVLKQEPDSAVRLAAAATLGVTKDPRTIEPLIAVLKQDKDSSVRSAAADALGEIKDRRAIDPLIAALRQDKDSSVRGAAAGALGKIKDHQAIDPLTTVLNTDSEVRENAIFALRDIGDKRAITPLLQYLTDWSVSKATAEALIGLGWEPQSERDRIRLLVAQRKGQDLRGRWELTKKVLLNEVETEDYRVIENALFAFIGIGRAEILPELVKKLEAKGNKTMAEAFLNCGHPELNKVARRWAKTHGYVVRAGTGASPVDWGEM